jgi:hypothetical protein
VFTAERPSIARRRRWGCGSRPTDATMRRSSPAPESEGKSSSKAHRSRSSRLGKIYWGEARWRWRRLEVETTKPHGQDEARNEAEQNRHRSGEEFVGDSQSPERIRVRVRPRGETSEGAAGWAEPIRSSPLGWTDRWAQAVSLAFLIVLIQKPLRKP